MNLEYQEKCHISFETDKGTSHLLTEFAHVQGLTQPQLLNKICQIYLAEKTLDILANLPPKMRNKILSED